MYSAIHSQLLIRHWVKVKRFLTLTELVAFVSLQQVAVILALNVGLTFSGCCATAGVFFSW